PLAQPTLHDDHHIDVDHDRDLDEHGRDVHDLDHHGHRHGHGHQHGDRARDPDRDRDREQHHDHHDDRHRHRDGHDDGHPDLHVLPDVHHHRDVDVHRLHLHLSAGHSRPDDSNLTRPTIETPP